MRCESVELRPRPTAATILARVTEEDIFRHFLGQEFKVGKKICSPLRDDSEPSFALFYNKGGNLCFKDFGTGHHGNVFEFVKLLFGIEYHEALNLIERKLIDSEEATKYTPQEVEHIKHKFKTDREYSVSSRMELTNEECVWWWNYGISKATLEKFGIESVLRIKDTVFDKTMTTDTGRSLFGWSEDAKWKFYNPFGGSVPKFFGNMNGSHLQGYQQAMEAEDKSVLIVTKSMKDVMVLHECGYPSVAPNSESTPLVPTLCRELFPLFERVYIMYDNDEAGRLGARKEVRDWEEYGLKAIEMPIGWKDISDFTYCTAYNKISEAKDLVRTLINK